MSYQQERLAEIAEAIREVEGSTEPIPATEFAERIRALGGAGGADYESFQVRNYISSYSLKLGYVTTSGSWQIEYFDGMSSEIRQCQKNSVAIYGFNEDAPSRGTPGVYVFVENGTLVLELSEDMQ